MTQRFLDTNVLLRYFTRDDERKADAALALLQRIEQGEERVVVAHTVIFETVFTLESFYKVPRSLIRDLVLSIVTLHGIELANKSVYSEALELYAERKVSFVDAWNAVFMRANGLLEIYSWDTDFDAMPWLARIEPGAPADA